MKMRSYIVCALAWLMVLAACDRTEFVLPAEGILVNSHEKVSGGICGMYLLNEGNMGLNKASIDYYDYTTGYYYRNIYGQMNPTEVKDLGDVGNDIKIFGDKLWAVINCSNYVEVMDVATARHLAKIAIPNCRYLAYDGSYVYVSSYAGPVQIDQNARIGYVAKINPSTYEVVETVTVGYQPEEMVIVGNKLYVANSGGYRVPNYDRTVSVIDLTTFKELYKIDVAINLHRLRLDNYGNLYVSSRGDYYNVPSKTYIVDTKTDKVTDEFSDLPNSNMALCGDSLYVLSTQYSKITERWTISYAIVDTRVKRIVARNFITDGTDGLIKVPYGVAVHPVTKEFFVTDAKDYVSPGVLICFTPDGKKKWSVTTGDIPAHMVFADKPFIN